jgi:hypothetical protein
MQETEKLENILLNALTEYADKNKCAISKVESGSLSNQFERGCGLTVTMDNGKVLDVLIMESDV